MTELLTLRVALNGTDINPFAKWGLTQNPFPQIAEHALDRVCLHLAALGGEPIPDADYIRRHLKGWTPEFVELCCEKFRPGEYVTFHVTAPR